MIRMKNKILVLCVLMLFSATAAFAQVEILPHPPLNPKNPNYEHDRITFMWLESQNEPVSDFDMNILRAQALKIHVIEAKVMRNKFIFQILENQKLPLDDRLWAADFFIRASDGDISYPLDYIKTLKSNLLLQKK